MKHVLFALFSLPAAAFAQAPLPDMVAPRMATVEAGVICAPETTGVLDAPDTVAGTTHIIAEEPPFVAVTRRVPAVLGIGFGVKSRSIEFGGLQDVTMKVTHPPMGASGTTQQSFATTIRGTDPSLTFYQFDFDYELLPGIWQMEASYDGEILFRTTFEVLRPEDAPELAAVCGFEELLS